jgi:hypothetical protein
LLDTLGGYDLACFKKLKAHHEDFDSIRRGVKGGWINTFSG